MRRRSGNRALAWILPLAACFAVLLAGCSSGKSKYVYSTDKQLRSYMSVATQIEEPSIESGAYLEAYGSAPPITINDGPPKYLDLTLEQVVRIALQNSTIIRRLRVSILALPGNSPTRFDPAIQETNPGPGLNDMRDIGVEAALAAFDASFAASVFFEKNDRALNNTFFGGGTRVLVQDVGVFQKQLSKKAITGTDFALRQTTTYDGNNAPGNTFPSAWDTIIEAEFRHPLLQGTGVRFNRINGSAGIAEVPNGILIARIATDIRLVDVETGIRDLVRDAERAYWALYFAYRELDAAVAARNSALETWRRVHALFVTGRRGGEAEKEAQAREQYFRFQEDVLVALSGGGRRPDDVFDRPARGVHELDRQLRYMIGLPINDGYLIRPLDEPPVANVFFDWDEVLIESLARRAELRKQKWEIKRTELELIAAKNYLLPRFDITGRYRWRGFGHDLLDPHRVGRGRFDNAFNTLTGGDFQEWTLGAELEIPLGYRQAHAKVRNAQLRLARNRAVLKEQERKVVQELSDAVARVAQTYSIMQTSFNRRKAAQQYLQSVKAAYHSRPETARLDLVLEAQRRVGESDRRYFASLVEYARSITQVHFVKGSLLDYNEIYLAEGPWPNKAYHDAARRERLRMPRLKLDDFTLHHAPMVSHGEYPQQMLPQHGAGSLPAELAPAETIPPGKVDSPPGKVNRLPALQTPAPM